HDELLIEAQEKFVDEVKQITKNIMESVIKLSVPLIVKVKEANSWEKL
ncbi:MAG: DNA polymerase, partial [Pseudomonadota bacterium]